MSQVCCGEADSFFLGPLGSIWASGSNDRGQHGRGDFQSYAVFTVVPSVAVIKQISCGASHTVCVSDSGQVWSFGDNSKCQLGVSVFHGTRSRSNPERVPISAPIVSVTCGINHTVCLDNEENCWAFGCNDYGQLGCESLRNARAEPEKIPNAVNIRLVACSNHTILVAHNRNVLVCGNNSDRQLGLPNDTSFECKRNSLLTRELQPVSGDIIGVSCTMSSTAVLNEKGEVFIAGKIHYSVFGSFCHMKSLSGICNISSGYDFYMCVDNNGNLTTFGDISHSHSLERTVEDSAVPKRIQEINSVAALSSGGHHAIVCDSEGITWAFASNNKGQLGLGYRHIKPAMGPTKLASKYSQIISQGNTSGRKKSARKV